jgi:hypothetical protein
MRDLISPMFGRLVSLVPYARPEQLELSDAAVTIGRAEGSSIVVAWPTVSRRHAVISSDGPRLTIADASSANGTYVNGVRIDAPTLLADRDTIGLGDVVSMLRYVDFDPTLVRRELLVLNEARLQFSVGSQGLDLTPNEFRLLHVLYLNRGSVCSRAQCAAAIWGPDYLPEYETEALDRLMSNMRAKLRRASPDATFILTRPGLGYELSV